MTQSRTSIQRQAHLRIRVSLEGSGHQNKPQTKTRSVPVVFEKRNSSDIVLFCGSPGSGKSTFYWQSLKPLGYERVNQDLLKSVKPPLRNPLLLLARKLIDRFLANAYCQQREKCLKVASTLLSEGKSVAVGKSSDQVRPQTVLT